MVGSSPPPPPPLSVFLLGMMMVMLACSGWRYSCCFAALREESSYGNNGGNSLFLSKSKRSSAIFPLRGSVYPDGVFFVTVIIGEPPKPYYLDVDTGSDLTWLQCDAPCVRCSKGPHQLYKPTKSKLVPCNDPLCSALGPLRANFESESSNSQCDYKIDYADQSSSLGVLVKNSFRLRFGNGSVHQTSLAFGCGYDQQGPVAMGQSATDGILGLGRKSSIVSQLKDQGLVRNVIGHCIGAEGGEGYLFFGDDLVPSSGVTWVPMHSQPRMNYYSPGIANVIFGKQGVKDVMVVFDSGSSYTYISSRAYELLVSGIVKDLAKSPLKKAPEEKALPLCWRGPKPFKSVADVKKFFKPLIFVFKSSKKAWFEIPPENFLIITDQGNACLGVLNGTEVGLGDLNLIGDISMQSRMIIYDNEKNQIGWSTAECNRLPKLARISDH